MNEKVFVPPFKMQGIKTKLVPLIKKTVLIDDDALWIEPFMGTGVVGFNIEPHRAIFADINPFLIDFYEKIRLRTITSQEVRDYLEFHGEILSQKGGAYYYEVRDNFNRDHSPLDFLFLNRSCFNGMMRFNRAGEFNVPYGHKPNRFSKAYITKIVNQVKHVEECLDRYDWRFVVQPFERTIMMAHDNCFIYCDPPYIGRHVDYFCGWDSRSELALCQSLQKSGAKFMVSTWVGNKYRQNEYIDSVWGKLHRTIKEHFYFVGGREENRNAMTEALLTNYIPPQKD